MKEHFNPGKNIFRGGGGKRLNETKKERKISRKKESKKERRSINGKKCKSERGPR